MNKKFDLTISQKITLVILITYTVVLGALFVANKTIIEQLKTSLIMHDAEQVAESIVVAADNKAERARLIRLANSFGANSNVAHIFIANKNTLSVIASNKNKYVGHSLLTIELLGGIPFNKNLANQGFQINGRQFYLTRFDVIAVDGQSIEPLLLVVELHNTEFNELLVKPNLYLLVFALIGFFVAITILLVTLKIQVFQPLRRLAKAISVGITNSTPIKVHSYNRKDEIGSLVKEYNLLIEKLTEKQLQLQTQTIKSQQAAQSKSDFLAVMSHEIRTPLNGIIGTSTLLEKTQITEQQKEYLTTIASSGSQLLALINNILDYSKLDAGKFELSPKRIEVNQFMREVYNLFQITAKEKNLTFNMTLLEHPCYIDADDVRLKQVLINLLGNAFKFTEEGHVSLNVYLLANQLTIVVSDTGIGLSETQAEKLFAKFVQADASTTRKYGGTGLGLAICKGIVNQMGGEINVTSEIKKGSSFTIELPVEIKAAPVEVPEQASVCPVSFKKLTILVVDDVPLNRMIAKAMLSQHTIVMAEHGLDAVKKVSEQTFDIILMDCLMPEMDGFDATRVIRKSNINTPIIALTASTLDEIRDECYACGMDDYLTKPLVEKDLIEKVIKWSTHSSSQ